MNAEARRLDVALVEAGHFSSRTRAAKAIAAGRVSIDGATAQRAAQPVAQHALIAVAGDEADRWVGRAAHKLLGALEAFTDVRPGGALCLDAGASTGGFTQVLLEAGARHVHAVDVGHDQLHPSLAADPRVSNHEGINVRGLTAGFVPGGVDLVVGDLSFISLRLVLAPLGAVTRPGGDLLLMVKPQFEVGRERLARTGVVTTPDHRREAVEGVLTAAVEAGLTPLGVQRSPLEGQDGNAEFFLHLRKAAHAVPAGSAPSQAAAEVRSSEGALSGYRRMLDAVDYR